MTLNLTKQTEGCRGEGVWEKGVGLWTLGRVCDLVSTVNCVSLTIHRPVPLEQIVHYMLIITLKRDVLIRKSASLTMVIKFK